MRAAVRVVVMLPGCLIVVRVIRAGSGGVGRVGGVTGRGVSAVRPRVVTVVAGAAVVTLVTGAAVVTVVTVASVPVVVPIVPTMVVLLGAGTAGRTEVHG